MKNSILLIVLLLVGFNNQTSGQNINITVLQAQYSSNGIFAGYPLAGFFTVVWKKDQQNIILEPNTVVLKIIFAPEAGYNTAEPFALPAGWQIQGTPHVNGITLVNTAPFSTENELVVKIPVKVLSPRTNALPLAGAYIQNSGGDWTNLSAGWDASTAVVVKDKPLPVVLVGFKARAQEDAIHVSWNTTMEDGFDRFELQKSLNPKNDFKLLATMTNQGNTTGSGYSYLDKDVEPGIQVYYRLKMIDRAADHAAGSFAFSRIVSAKIESNLSINVYPNPVDKFVEINALSEITQVEIVNLNGETVMSRKFEGSNKKERISTEKLNTGSHVVKIATAKGKVQSKKVVIIH